MSEGRRRGPLATRVDDPNRRPGEEDWNAPSTAETRCQSCDNPIPADARFCPACRHEVGTPVPDSQHGDEVDKREASVVVTDASLGAVQTPAPAVPVARVRVEVIPVAPPPPAPPTPITQQPPTPLPPAPKKRKGLPTLQREAGEAQALVDEDARALRRIGVIFIPAIAVAATLFLIWLLAFRDRPRPTATQPVSSAPISLLPYDAGTD